MLLAVVLAAATAGGCVSLTPYEVVREKAAGSLLEVDGQEVYVEDRPALRGGGGNLAEGSEGSTAAAPETVVLVHGFGASAYSWRNVVPLLPEYRTVALDLRGFGFTERPPGILPYTRTGQVELILGVMDRLGIERAHLVGHSYGGALALALAEEHPERLLSLVLVDAAHPDYLRSRRTVLATFQPPLDLYLRLWALRPGLVRRALEASVAKDSVVTHDLVRAYLDRLAIEGAPRAYHGLTAPLPEEGLPPAEEDPVELGEVTRPTLVVWGEADSLISVAAGREAASHIPCHRFVVLPGVGHLPMEEDPEALAAAIREFLRQPGEACPEDGPARASNGAGDSPPPHSASRR